MKEMTIEARKENLAQALAFVDEVLEEAGCPMKTQMQVDVAVEELFVNIASYAYGDGVGTALLQAEVSGDPPVFSLTLIDSGLPYDPLAKEDPDITLSAQERQIGGLGIFMVKQMMDDMRYEYRDGQNHLTVLKKLRA